MKKIWETTSGTDGRDVGSKTFYDTSKNLPPLRKRPFDYTRESELGKWIKNFTLDCPSVLLLLPPPASL